jgi:hypothetical protein
MIGVYNTNTGFTNSPVRVRVLGCLGDENVFWRPSDLGGTREEGTHNDCSQIQSGSDIQYVGNVFKGAYCTTKGEFALADPAHQGQSTACLMITPAVGLVADVLYDRNWLYGGSIQINVAEGGRGGIPDLRITGNKFDHTNASATQYRVALINGATYDTAVITGNTFEDGVGTPVFTRVNSTA